MDILTQLAALACRSNWDYDSTTINTPIGSANVPGMFDANFTHDSTWIGAGYNF